MAKIVSTGLNAGAATTVTGAGRGAGAGATEARAETGAAPARGAAGGAACGGAAALLKAGAGGAAEAPLGPPGGSVGSLIVGAAEGFGGKLIRTVSFLGWTLPVSFFGGTAPPGVLGILSAIALSLNQPRLAAEECQLIIGFPSRFLLNQLPTGTAEELLDKGRGVNSAAE